MKIRLDTIDAPDPVRRALVKSGFCNGNRQGLATNFAVAVWLQESIIMAALTNVLADYGESEQDEEEG